MKLDIDKSDWPKVRFGDIAIQQKENVDRETTQLKRYVAGEHMATEDLHLRTWGEINGDYLGPAFHRKFSKGDILYGSRRTYLRKVAVAHFDGITANTTFVIKSNQKYIVKELLPFIMLSENFAQHSIKNSKGSVNPYINWKDIANYEFLLPPKDQQNKIAELLWAADNLIERNSDLYIKSIISNETYIKKEIQGTPPNRLKISELLNYLSKNLKMVPLSKLGIFLKGKGIPKEKVIPDGLPCIRYGEIYTTHNIVIRKFYSFISRESANESTLLKQNDLIIAGSGETREDIGKSCAYYMNIEAYAGGDTIIFRSEKIDITYLSYVMNSTIGRSQLSKYGTGATIFHIYIDDLKKILVPLPSIEEQKSIVNLFENFYDVNKHISNNVIKVKEIQRELINKIF